MVFSRIIVRIRIHRILGLAGLKKSRKAKLFCDQFPVNLKIPKIMVQTVCRARIIVRIRIYRILGLAGLKKSRKAKLFCDQIS